MSVGFDGNERLEVAVEFVYLAVSCVCRSRWIRCAKLVVAGTGCRRVSSAMFENERKLDSLRR